MTVPEMPAGDVPRLFWDVRSRIVKSIATVWGDRSRTVSSIADILGCSFQKPRESHGDLLGCSFQKGMAMLRRLCDARSRSLRSRTGDLLGCSFQNCSNDVRTCSGMTVPEWSGLSVVTFCDV